MRYLLRGRGFCVVPAVLLSGCGDQPAPNPVWKTMCEAFCTRGMECFSYASTSMCVSLCLDEFGSIPCEADPQLLDECVAGIASLSCEVVEEGEFPPVCAHMCTGGLCEGINCDDGNECTDDVCDPRDGSCDREPFPDGTPCSGGGAIFTDIDVTLTRSTVSGNDAGAWGGGISIRGGEVVLTNSTVSGNSAGNDGGGISKGGSDTLTLTHTTLANNAAPIGPAIAIFAPVTFASSILEDGCSLEGGVVTSQGHNIESPGDTCGLDPLLDDRVEEDVSLAPLDDNGGPTRTHLPSQTSPAVNAIPAEDCSLSTDQRGITRPQGSGCDVGAVEVEAP